MADPIYPLTVYTFTVNIDGHTVVGGFSECSGLGLDNDVIEYRTGDDPPAMRKLPGLRKYTNLVLKRGYVKDLALYTWRQAVIAGTAGFRTTGEIVMNDENFKPALQWNFYGAWPSKLDGPGLNAKNNEVAVETLELVIERLEFKQL